MIQFYIDILTITNVEILYFNSSFMVVFNLIRKWLHNFQMKEQFWPSPTM